MDFEVRITVVREITVPVEAASMAEAKEIAMRKWNNKEYDLTATHSRRCQESTKFETLYPNYTRPLSFKANQTLPYSNQGQRAANAKP